MARNPQLKNGVELLSQIRDAAHAAKCEAHAERREVQRAVRLIEARLDLLDLLGKLGEEIAEWQNPSADAADAKGGGDGR